MYSVYISIISIILYKLVTSAVLLVQCSEQAGATITAKLVLVDHSKHTI
jgi:hypothetical protein